MKSNRCLTWLLIALLNILSLSCAPRRSGDLNIIPTPQEIKITSGYFEIKPTTSLCVADDNLAIGEYLQAVIASSAGFRPELKSVKCEKAIILCKNDNYSNPANEAYRLEITTDRIEISANSQAGYFYGVQTLLQLLPPEIFSGKAADHTTWQVPCVEITDAPKYDWRSFMLDSGRQYQSVDFIKRYLDILAMLKINVFHWHLTEGQGWRIEIKKYPKLTGIGSRVAKGEEQQGYYTQQDIEKIVDYAKSRFITVVPEIDVPGHAEAALIAYPELACFAQAPESVMGYSPNLVCAGKEANYQFLEAVLDEVCELFPGEYIHLGGDEAPKDNWNLCPACRKKIREQGLKDSHDLQLYFSKRLAEYLRGKGKKAIFWGDVVYQDGMTLPDNVVIYWWNARGHGDLAYRNAIKRGHPVICGTNAYCYLNYPVVPWSEYKESRTFDLKTTYENNPADLPEPDRLVLGMGCCLWTDWHVKMSMIDQRVFPRIYSLAEQMWHKGERLSFDAFYAKIKRTYPRLNALDIDYGPAMANEVPAGYKWD